MRKPKKLDHVAAIAPLLFLAVVLSISGASGAVAGWSFTGLGQLGEGDAGYAYAVSADGSVVVGAGERSGGRFEAFRWTFPSGVEWLGTLGGDNSFAYAVSGDGQIVVGKSDTADGYVEAFRWEQDDVPALRGLGFLPQGSQTPTSTARGVSDLGVVVGHGRNTSFAMEAFFWSDPGPIEGLGGLKGFAPLNFSEAEGVSGNGQVVVGYARTDFAGSVEHAFRWTEAQGMSDLGTLAGNDASSHAFAASYDGSTVIGQSRNASGKLEAFLWRDDESPQMIGLGFLDATDLSSKALGVSHDGSVVVGALEDSEGRSLAFIWDEAGGMRDLGQWLATQGSLAMALDGWELWAATAVSGDGRTIAGWGLHQGRHEAFVVTVPEPGGPLLLLCLAALGVLLAVGNRLRGDAPPPGYDQTEIDYRES